MPARSALGRRLRVETAGEVRLMERLACQSPDIWPRVLRERLRLCSGAASLQDGQGRRDQEEMEALDNSFLRRQCLLVLSTGSQRKLQDVCRMLRHHCQELRTLHKYIRPDFLEIAVRRLR